jgi:endonuclease/exonuclease/phosphatase family metal-dependent hydrolase
MNMRGKSIVVRLLVAWGLLVPLASALAAEEPLRVMTFNIRYGTANDGQNSWPNRQELLLATIRKFDPDLLGTQEVLAMQVDFLAENLKEYAVVGVGRDDGKRRGEFSTVLYKTKRFEPVDSGTFWLSETPDKPGSKSWDSSLPRVATWVKLRDRLNADRELVFLNTHWDHRGDRARTESGRIIREWLTEHAAGLPAIVTGDLNVAENHAGVRALLSSDGGSPALVDAYRQVHREAAAEEGTFHGFSGRRGGRRIDHIVTTPDWTAAEATIDYTNNGGRYPSDHYPVTAVLMKSR